LSDLVLDVAVNLALPTPVQGRPNRLPDQVSPIHCPLRAPNVKRIHHSCKEKSHHNGTNVKNLALECVPKPCIRRPHTRCGSSCIAHASEPPRRRALIVFDHNCGTAVAGSLCFSAVQPNTHRTFFGQSHHIGCDPSHHIGCYVRHFLDFHAIHTLAHSLSH
jgi:hypothetical protein